MAGGSKGSLQRLDFRLDSCVILHASDANSVGRRQHLSGHANAMSSTSDEIPEADLRDLLVEAFFAGDRDRVMTLGRAIVAEVVEQGGTYGDEVATGVMLPFAMEPTDPADYLDLLDGVATEERIEALWDGAGLTTDERAFVIDAAARQVFSGDADIDRYPLWAVCSLTHPDERTAYIATAGTGCSFSEVNVDFLGAFAAAGEALAAVQRLGYISLADWESRHPGTQRS